MRQFIVLSVLAFTTLTAHTARAAINPAYGIGWDTTSASDYAMLNRGLTLDAHEVELALRFTWIDIDDAPNPLYLDINASYGLTSRLEVGLETFFELNPDSSWSQTFIPRLLYSVYASRDVDFALTGFLVLDFDGNDPETLPLIQFGAPVRIKFGDGFALMFGHNAVTWGRVPDDYLNLDINVALTKQLSRDFALRFDTQVASLNIAGDAQTTSYGDIVPLGAALVFSPDSRFDLTAGLIYQAIDNGPNQLALNGGLFFRF